MNSNSEQITPFILLHITAEFMNARRNHIVHGLELVRMLNIDYAQMPRLDEQIILPMGLSDSDRNDVVVTQVSHNFDSLGRIYFTQLFCEKILRVSSASNIVSVLDRFVATATEAGFMPEHRFWELNPPRFL